PDFYVDLCRQRPSLRGIPTLQRKLQTDFVCPARHSWRVADGAALFFLRAEAGGERGLQPPAETCVHLRHRARRFISADGDCDLEAGAVFMVGMDDGRV